MRNLQRPLAVLVLLLTTLPLIAAEEKEEERMPLYDTLGPYGRTITTSSPSAQRYFDQGLALAYAFGRREAVKAFREAQREDETCAMCFWGEAWALGPYINEKMKDKAAGEAYAAIEKAQELADSGSDVERALIQAMAKRYAAESEERQELDTAYVDAMRDVVRRFGDDLDAATLLGESLMVLRPWDFWTPEGEAYPETAEATAVLETVLARHLSHPGACHLYIHAVEASPNPARAEACADVLADAIPGASHIQHMPSHIYMGIGRYGDSVRANQEAWLADQQSDHGLAVAIYRSHNLDMLSFAAWMDGQSAVALQATRDMARSASRKAFYYALMLARFGRWEEILELTVPSNDDEFRQGLWHFSRGLAELRTGRPDFARAELRQLSRITQATSEDATYSFPSHRRVDILGTAEGLLEGELAASEGRYDDAVRVLEAAAVLEDNFPYSEPEVWPLPVLQTLGAVLLEAGRPADAERAYRQELVDHVENGWSLYGLAEALKAQQKAEEADAVRKRFDEAWARADVFLTASRF
jgi:tetratricopeptide (TPR) repeat protein